MIILLFTSGWEEKGKTIYVIDAKDFYNEVVSLEEVDKLLNIIDIRGITKKNGKISVIDVDTVLAKSRLLNNSKSTGKFDLSKTIYGIKISNFKGRVDNVIIPDIVNFIDTDCFRFNFSIKTVKLPENLIEIGYTAFVSCTSLERVEFNKYLKFIDDGAFSGCFNLKDIELPETVSEIGSMAFRGCSTLNSVIMKDSITKISSSCFESCTELKNVRLPSSLKVISASMFAYCKSLKRIDIPRGVEEIKFRAFNYSGLEELKIPDTVKTVGRAFVRCYNLKEVIIPSSVESIDKLCFQDCESLSEIIIEDNEPVYSKLVEAFKEGKINKSVGITIRNMKGGVAINEFTSRTYD